MIARAVFVAVSFTALVCAAGSAAAQNAAAEAAFEKGRGLMAQGKYAEACAAFEQSQKIEPQLGTQYNLGLCYDKAGKSASAWAILREVAQRDTNATRKAKAADRAAAIAPTLTKLLINVESTMPGLKVESNGADVTATLGIETPVDPGAYHVEASAPGFHTWSADVAAQGAGLTITVSIPTLTPEPTTPHPDTGGGTEHTGDAGDTGGGDGDRTGDAGERGDDIAVAATTSTGRGRRKLGVITAASGGALLAGGLVFGILARGKWSDAKAACGGDLVCDNDADLARANDLQDTAKLDGNLATALVGVGAVAVGVGVVLYVTAPHGEHHRTAMVTPTAGRGHVGLAVEGSF